MDVGQKWHIYVMFLSHTSALRLNNFHIHTGYRIYQSERQLTVINPDISAFTVSVKAFSSTPQSYWRLFRAQHMNQTLDLSVICRIRRAKVFLQTRKKNVTTHNMMILHQGFEYNIRHVNAQK